VGPLWQGRFFDHAVRTVKEYYKTLEYIHWIPVKAGLVGWPDDWRWSSVQDYSESTVEPIVADDVLAIDQVDLPWDQGSASSHILRDKRALSSVQVPKSPSGTSAWRFPERRLNEAAGVRGGRYACGRPDVCGAAEITWVTEKGGPCDPSTKNDAGRTPAS
jgi:hypothetical protein